ncbi:MAG: alanine--tRNA ligase [Elusimicrobia bacterium RIFOXYA12_FULL_51_18]|nr:MAG: alanine--tRNA ligase [Elusimicrobia bacterium RIFOXYA12_FULL_51_18]OGS32169.1 MAG: alanine--tRNA ligase [Elusimicrobia bacterium RIFOXYA2_FULL_53_38]
MKSYEIRKGFLDFFAKYDHPIVQSSPLIPEGDPTLLFTSAGMVQFKPYYLGLKTDKKRAASCQKSFRTTDIDNVGKTIRHLTFFEMLGNFSFGDYFKDESIKWGWEFLTREMGLPAERLYPSIYKGGVAPRDQEARGIWESVLPQNLHSHIVELGDSDNFWSMGDTGPSGPCSEIYWDRGEKYAHNGCKGAGCSCDRYIEIWNHVFTQFDKQPGGIYAPLPKKNIDTGLGLERLAFIVEGKETPFDTSLFYPIISGTSGLLKVKYDFSGDTAANFRIISDHLRAAVFLISEGIMPSNEGRGYVLRRLVRRAERFGRMLGAGEPFLYRLVPSVFEVFKGVYPEIVGAERHIVETLKFEEEGFLETLETGEKFLADLLDKHAKEIPGDVAFKLYETYGFPVELTREIALKRGAALDEKGFEAARKNAQGIAKAGWKDSGEKNAFIFQTAEQKFPATVFLGYDSVEAEARILGLLDTDGKPAESMPAGAEGYAVLDRTPFYAESGGQVGDTGSLSTGGAVVADILDVQKPAGKVFFHRFKAGAGFKIGAVVMAKVSSQRFSIAANHTAVHVVNAALKTVFGPGTRQAGSIVTPEKFRFDYTISKTPTAGELDTIENMANAAIVSDYKVFKMERPLADAEKFGAVTLLGEKYADPARFVLINKGGWDSAGDRYSLELCGGTHIDGLAQLVLIKILKDSAVSRGVRRIEGVAGPAAVAYLSGLARIAEAVSFKLSVPPQELQTRVDQLLQNIKELKANKGKSAQASGEETIDLPGGIKFVVLETAGAAIPELRGIADQLKNKYKSSVLFLFSSSEGKLSFISSSTVEGGRFSASALVKDVAGATGGSGGGRPDFAQGGGPLPADMADFRKKVIEFAKKHI